MEALGFEWLEGLIANNPRWVRGTATPATILMSENQTEAASFTTGLGLASGTGYNISWPTDAPFTSWPQTGAILKDAPHPEAAKLLHSYILSEEFQLTQGWSVRTDVATPGDLPAIWDMPNTNVTAFAAFMNDRTEVERLKLFYETYLGTAQGLSPLVDDL